MDFSIRTSLRLYCLDSTIFMSTNWILNMLSFLISRTTDPRSNSTRTYIKRSGGAAVLPSWLFYPFNCSIVHPLFNHGDISIDAWLILFIYLFIYVFIYYHYLFIYLFIYCRDFFMPSKLSFVSNILLNIVLLSYLFLCAISINYKNHVSINNVISLLWSWYLANSFFSLNTD